MAASLDNLPPKRVKGNGGEVADQNAYLEIFAEIRERLLSVETDVEDIKAQPRVYTDVEQPTGLRVNDAWLDRNG